jgi:hypothetical protein
VALSRRLRDELAELYRARFEPSPEALVFEGVDPANFRHREWRRILKRAGIGHRALKDLRDTYASQLLTAGVQLGYVSTQLGHADVAVTAHHYAHWIEGDAYREPMRIASGEVPADLLARLSDPTSDPTRETAESGVAANPSSVLRNSGGDEGDRSPDLHRLRMRALVGTPSPPVTRHASAPATWFADVPRI